MITDKVRVMLLNAGASEYRETQKYISAGFMVGAATRRECLVTYQTPANVPATMTDKRLGEYSAVLRANGLNVRPAQQLLAIVVNDPSVPLDTSAPSVSYHAPDIEAYRRRLLFDTARMFRQAIKQHTANGLFLTDQGRIDIRRKMQTILDATTGQLQLWRQRGI